MDDDDVHGVEGRVGSDGNRAPDNLDDSHPFHASAEEEKGDREVAEPACDEDTVDNDSFVEMALGMLLVDAVLLPLILAVATMIPFLLASFPVIFDQTLDSSILLFLPLTIVAALSTRDTPFSFVAANFVKRKMRE